MGKTLVTSPFIGELGWEVFSWQPLLHELRNQQPWDKMVVYTRPGRSLMYPWAEVRTNPEGPDFEAECLLWHDFDEAKQKAFNQMTESVVASAKAEFGEAHAAIFSIASLGRFNIPHYERGRPDLLRVKDVPERWTRLKKDGPLIVLCVRDRKMSDYRNWPKEQWRKMADGLPGTVVVTGRSDDPAGWTDALAALENVYVDINETTIDDLIQLFSVADLAIGGSTGTLHLASRCACPHLVWGGEKEVLRYAETNWFGAQHKVLEVGWNPEPGTVLEAVKEFGI